MNRQNLGYLDAVAVVAGGWRVSGRSVAAGLPSRLAERSAHAESSRAEPGPR